MYYLNFIFLIVYELLGFTFMYWLDSCLDLLLGWVQYLGSKKEHDVDAKVSIRFTRHSTDVFQQIECLVNRIQWMWRHFWKFAPFLYIVMVLMLSNYLKFAPFLRIMMFFSLSNYLKICSVLLHDLSIKCVAKVVALARAKADKAYWLCFYDVFFWLLLFLHALMGTRGKGGWAARLERS
jgi:hypothetical protein